MRKMKQKKVEVETAEVEVQMSDETFLTIAKYAHSKDITFNEAVTELLRKHIESLDALAR